MKLHFILNPSNIQVLNSSKTLKESKRQDYDFIFRRVNDNFITHIIHTSLCFKILVNEITSQQHSTVCAQYIIKYRLLSEPRLGFAR